MFLIFLANILWLSSCYPTRNIPKEHYLLTKNSYKIKGETPKKHNIPLYFSQKTNKEIIFFRFYLRAYDFGTIFADSSFLNRTLTQKVGEPPVVYDSNLVIKTGKNIKKHLDNLGYYNNQVSAEITKFPVLKIAKVRYVITPNKPYVIRNVDIKIDDREVKSFVMADFGKTNMVKGELFSVMDLKSERERIASNLKNTGFFYFIKDQVVFDADTNLNTHEVDLTLRIKELTGKYQDTDSTYKIKNKRYKIQNIYVFYNINESNSNQKHDTTIYEQQGKNGEPNLVYHFIHDTIMNMNPKAIVQALYMKPGKFYKYLDIMESYKALTSFNVFKFININLVDLRIDSLKYGQLNCYVKLLNYSTFAINSDTELKNTGGDFGLEQSLGFKYRNTFHNAEILSLGFRGAMEMQNVTNYSSETSVWPFNVYEAGTNLSLDIPRLLVPFIKGERNRYLRPRTLIQLGYNFQNRPDYMRTIVNSSFGLNLKPLSKVELNFKILEIGAVKIFPEPNFQKIIDDYEDPRIKYSYTDHLVLASNFSYRYDEHKFKALTPFNFFFFRVEIGGLGWDRLASASPSDSLGQKILFGLPISQYGLMELDYRRYLPAGKNVMNVFRAHLGIGIPLFNTKALPFEKSFYIGGANSLRAWTLGTLGPGSYNTNSTSFEMTGDIVMEFNYELRFTISGSLEGAIYTDVGNIWLLNGSDQMTGANILFPDMLQQFAIDFGYGLRYDLEFLLLRVDIAHPIYQPYLSQGSRWTALGTNGKPIMGFNFAIGYPF